MQDIVISGETTTGGAATEVSVVGRPPIDTILSAELIVALHAHTFTGDAIADHGHVSAVVLNSEVAADQTAFVGMQDGAGAAVGAVIGEAGGGTDYDIPSSSGGGHTPSGSNSSENAARKALTVVSGTPDADGEIQLTGTDKFELYLDTGMATNDILVLHTRVSGEILRP